ncbi:MAG: F0F1 ATP synthase subunit A, partial [Planctomycetes bacterium]|nr:F0F1 ATP synthase subunit A [Planctomycetota bacterium]
LAGWGGSDAAGRPMNVTPIGGTPASGVCVCAAFAAMTFLLVVFAGYWTQFLRLWKGAPNEEQPGHEGPRVRAGANLWMGCAQLLERRTWPWPAAAVLAVWSWLNGFVPAVPGVVGLFMWPMMLIVEMIGYVTRCFALCIRLVANMTGGHILLAVLMTFAQASEGWSIPLVGLPAGIGVLAMMLLELLVGLIQAYIFTFLSALFIGLAMGTQH